MAAYALVHPQAGSLARENLPGRFLLTRADTNGPKPSNSGSGWPHHEETPSPVCGCSSEVLAPRDEIESLRNEVRRLQEEVEFWKAESQKHFCDAQYWRAMHQKALERVAQRDQEIDRLKGEVRGLRQQLFGRKTEKGKAGQAPQSLEKTPSGRRRGQQAGSVGHGRRDHSHLPCVITSVDLPENERRCPQCHQPYAEFPDTEDSGTIEIDVRAHRRVIRRKRYRRTCSCPTVPGIITAPAPPRLFPKGIVGISIWTTVLLDKFLFYRPTHRLLEDLRTYGVNLPPGTLTDGLRRFLPLLAPIYAAIVAESRCGVLWSADETRWMVFVQIEKKSGYRWYLWVFQSATAIAFELDPSRSHRVPDDHFQGVEGGILLVDRYSGYKAMELVKNGTILLAFCWAHVRRDFIRVGKNWPKLAAWALEWLLEIRELYHLNRQRLLARHDPAAFAALDRRLREAVDAMAAKRDEQLGRKDLHPACRKALNSLSEHWKGLTLFVEHPDVPMDNNRTERTQRGPVVGRNNYHGSGALWSGELAAMLFSLFSTLKLYGINPRQWLTAYLEACATAGGKAPENAAAFLPWNMTEEVKATMRAPFRSRPDANNSS
jgi:transposase